MQRLVDIALVNALLMLPDTGALLRFIQQPNALELEMGKALLTSNGRYSELVALYKVRIATCQIHALALIAPSHFHLFFNILCRPMGNTSMHWNFCATSASVRKTSLSLLKGRP
jgi:hypothetical protein